MSKVRLKVGYRKEVSLKSRTDERSFNQSFIFPKMIDNDKIEIFFESLCDVWVTKVKDVEEWKVQDIETKKTKDVRVLGSFELNGKRVATNKIYIPRVKRVMTRTDIDRELKRLYGSSFEIRSYQEIE